jgi:hypothetical protein
MSPDIKPKSLVDLGASDPANFIRQFENNNAMTLAAHDKLVGSGEARRPASDNRNDVTARGSAAPAHENILSGYCVSFARSALVLANPGCQATKVLASAAKTVGCSIGSPRLS